MSENTRWTVGQENLLRKWGQEFKDLEKLHSRTYSFYSSVDTCFIVLGIITSSISAAISSLLSLGAIANPSASQVAAASLSATHLLLAAIQKATGPAQASSSHKNIAIQYGLLWTKIEVQLSLPRGLRASPERFIKQIETDRAGLIRNSESIPSWLFDDYKPARGEMEEIIHNSELELNSSEDIDEYNREVQIYLDSDIQKQFEERMKKIATSSANLFPTLVETPSSPSEGLPQ